MSCLWLSALSSCVRSHSMRSRIMPKTGRHSSYTGESVQIASGYADNYNKYSFSLQDFQKQMQSLGEYLSAQIWIMDNQGNILF